MSLFAPLLLSCFLIAIQGFLLQTAVALTGDPAPSYGRALITSMIAGTLMTFGVLSWGCTFGLLLGFISKPLATLLSILVGLVITSAVYRTRLRISGGHALVIAGLHHLMAWGVGALLWTLVRNWPF